ncbi:alkaline phosphatase family protein [Arthrobacter sp. FW306-04-A]|uniref:alkaline phosphatase family protein n=1 Tax=Arthrobacter sp. FW306-04-A TaxID=2879619 RepID=UPI0037C167CA|nr:alkaline phosphatase family protein [Arthrobacter sp. FW306-04-A]
MRGKSTHRFVVASLLTLMLTTGCEPHGPSAGPSGSGSASASIPDVGRSGSASASAPAPRQSNGTVAAGAGGFDHVVIIVEENKPASDILGKGAAPYINKLAGESALANNYQALAHPSLPNYLALTSGTTAGITDDCSPGGNCTAAVPSIVDRIEQSGRSWKMYAEGMPTPCAASNSGKYAVRHNPFMYYPGVTGDRNNCAAHVVPFTRFTADLASASTLPNYVFISPNLCNDMHDCPVDTGDAWLAQQVPRILASPAFVTQKSLLVITWDEGSDESNAVGAIFAGPAARKGYQSGAPYSHYSLLHTIEASWGLAPLTNNDQSAPVMDDLLN